MKRGEIWTIAGGGDYTAKPRPAVIVQDDDAVDLDSITVCGLTTDETMPSMFRVSVNPTAANGLAMKSQIMVDKVTTVQRSRLGVRIGELNSDTIEQMNAALIVFLGLTATWRTSSPRIDA